MSERNMQDTRSLVCLLKFINCGLRTSFKDFLLFVLLSVNLCMFSMNYKYELTSHCLCPQQHYIHKAHFWEQFFLPACHCWFSPEDCQTNHPLHSEMQKSLNWLCMNKTTLWIFTISSRHSSSFPGNCNLESKTCFHNCNFTPWILVEIIVWVVSTYLIKTVPSD